MSKQDTFAARLRHLRESMSYSRRELAEYSGVPERTIVNLELQPERQVSLGVAAKLAQALGVSIDQLAGVPDA